MNASPVLLWSVVVVFCAMKLVIFARAVRVSMRARAFDLPIYDRTRACALPIEPVGIAVVNLRRPAPDLSI